MRQSSHPRAGASMIASKSIIFVDSITDLTRQAMAWAKTRPEAFSREDRQAGHPRRLRAARPRGDRPLEAPAARAGQDGDLRRHPGEASPTSSTGRPGSRRWRAARPPANCPGIVDQVISMSLFGRDGDGWRHDPDARRASAGSSAAPAIPSPCRPRTAPAGSTSPSRPTSGRCSPRSTPPRKDESDDVRHERCRAAEGRRSDPRRRPRQAHHAHPAGWHRRVLRGR